MNKLQPRGFLMFSANIERNGLRNKPPREALNNNWVKYRILLYDRVLKLWCLNFQPFHAKCWKMTNNTLQILWCAHCKIFKVRLAIFQHYAWKSEAKPKKMFLKEFVRIRFDTLIHTLLVKLYSSTRICLYLGKPLGLFPAF